MNESPYLGETTDLILGQEFLTWLWFRSATGAIFNDPGGRPFTVTLDQHIVVQGGEGERVERASVSGVDSELREARMGLTTGKKVTRAGLRIERDAETYKLTLKAADFSISGLKPPKIDRKDQEGDDEALLLETIFLFESCLEMMDAVYAGFLKLRLDDKAWRDEVRQLQDWMNR